MSWMTTYKVAIKALSMPLSRAHDNVHMQHALDIAEIITNDMYNAIYSWHFTF